MATRETIWFPGDYISGDADAWKPVICDLFKKRASGFSRPCLLWFHFSRPVTSPKYDLYEASKGILKIMGDCDFILGYDPHQIEYDCSQSLGMAGLSIYYEFVDCNNDGLKLKRCFENKRRSIYGKVISNSQKSGSGIYDKALSITSWSQNLNQNQALFKDMISISTIGKRRLRNRNNYKRCVVVAAGPSLDKNIAQLAYRPKNIKIVATNSAIRALMFRKIIPDIIVAAEEHVVLQRYLEGIESLSGIKLLTSTTTHPAFLKKAQDLGADIYFYNNNSESLKNRWFYDGKKTDAFLKVKEFPLIDPIAGNITFHGVALARYLGFDDIAIIGCDLLAESDNHHDKNYPVGMNSRGNDHKFLSALRHSFAKTLELSKKIDPQGITNCTEGGVLDTFPCSPLLQWFSMKGV